MSGKSVQRIMERPRWEVGQTWTAQFRVERESAKKLLDPPRIYEDLTWSFSVVTHGEDGTVVEAKRIDGAQEDSSTTLLRFAADGEFRGTSPEDFRFPQYYVMGGPYLASRYNSLSSLVLAWPHFPLQENAPQSYRGGLLHQSASFDGREWTVQIRSRDTVLNSEMRLSQTWVEGEPWWRTLRLVGAGSEKPEDAGRLVAEGTLVESPTAHEVP